MIGESLFVGLLAMLLAPVFGCLLAINSYATCLRQLFLDVRLWIERHPDTIREIERDSDFARARACLRNYYVLSYDLHHWFNAGVILSIAAPLVTACLYAFQALGFVSEQVMLYFQIIVLCAVAFWLAVCLRKYQQEHNRVQQISVEYGN